LHSFIMSLPPLVTATSFPPVSFLPPQSTAGTIPLDITSSLPVEPKASSVVSSPSVVPTSSSGGGDGGGGVGSSLTNSGALYLYTFLATLILLLSVSGLIAARSIIHNRRHRRMVEEAIRNGTYVPPVRPGDVDLSKEPQLWEAYLGGDGGWQRGSFSYGNGRKGFDIGTSWKSEYSRDWESIKPICAGYTEPLTSVSRSGSTSNLINTSLSPPVSIPAPISVPRGDDEENQRTTAVVSDGTTPSLLTRARIFLKNPNSASSSAENETNSPSNSPNSISMTRLIPNSPPPTIRVAVLIAMPSPSSSSSSSSHGSYSTPRSTSLSSKSQKPTTSLPSPTTTLRDEKQQQLEQPLLLPQLEIGVADVVVKASGRCSSTWDSSGRRREEKTTSFHSQGSSSSYAEP